MIENLQVIFIIKKEDAVDCLQISENLFDITYSKILNLKNLESLGKISRIITAPAIFGLLFAKSLPLTVR